MNDAEKWTETHILRNNDGMFRDCWFTNDEQYFCIRQTKFDENSSLPVTKIIRLSPEETLIVYQVIKTRMEKLGIS